MSMKPPTSLALTDSNNQVMGCMHINYGVDFIAERFLRSTSVTWSDNVLEVMQHLGEAASFERVTAYKHHRPIAEPVRTGLRYEWVAEGLARRKYDSEANLLEMKEGRLTEWAQTLRKGEVVVVEAEVVGEHEGRFFGEGMKQAVLVPVFVDEQWWGFFGFEDGGSRGWNFDEVETLKAVATIYGSAIWRKRLEEELEQQKESVELQVHERTKQLEKARVDLEAAVRRVQDQRARLLASIQSLSVGFVMTDINGKIVLLNDAVKKIFAEQNRPLESIAVIDEILGEGSLLTDKIGACIETVEANRIDDVHYRDLYLDIWMTPITTVDDERRVIGVVLLLDDVTEAKVLQQSRDEFFAVASHELRTPLTAIRGNASMMLEYFPNEMKDERLREIAEDIYNSSKRLIDIVNEYLDVSRMEMDSVKVVLEKMDLVAACREVMDSISVTAREKGLEFELQLVDLERLMVWGDVRRVQQVLYNLIGNAIKYTDKGGVYVKVEDLGESGRVVVYDTGPGITHDKQDLLFQKFSRLGDRAYQSHVKDSTGMGLYIAKLIAEAMGAKVYLERSQPGVGSGFALELTRVKDEG